MIPVLADRGTETAKTLEGDVPGPVLADSRRRYVIDCLEEYEEVATLSELARDVAVREDNCTVADVSEDRLEYVRNDLYHKHLPKLDDAGAVEFDASARTIAATLESR